MMLWPTEFLDPGSGRIGRRSLWLHKAPPLMKDLAQQLRRPEAWKPTHLSPLVSFDPVRPPASRPREDAERWRGEGDCRFQPSRVSCCDITVLVATGFSKVFRYSHGHVVVALNLPKTTLQAAVRQTSSGSSRSLAKSVKKYMP